MICHTCCRQPATQVAMADGASWPVCGGCVRQAGRFHAKVAHRPMRADDHWPDPNPATAGWRNRR